MKPIEVIEAKREYLARLANQRGALGESSAIGEMQEWIPRPKGPGLKILLAALRESGVNIKPSSFDAISLPSADSLDFTDLAAVTAALPNMVFVEIKTSNQERVTPNFAGFFFALTEGEIYAAEALGSRHKVAL